MATTSTMATMSAIHDTLATMMKDVTPCSMLSYTTGLLFLTLLTAHTLTPYPLSKLGKRPLGNGLFTYLRSQLLSLNYGGGGGVWGYDSSLGSFHPLWRVSFHICGIMFCSFGLLSYLQIRILQHSADIGMDMDVNASLKVAAVIFATLSYMICHGIIWTFGRGVSHPGGPREHKIRRMPKWDNVTTTIDPKLLVSSSSSSASASLPWRCAVAQDSHISSLKRFGLDPTTQGGTGVLNEQIPTSNDNGKNIGLCGEPFGRQLWTTEMRDVSMIKGMSRNHTSVNDIINANVDVNANVNVDYGTMSETNSVDTDMGDWTKITPSVDNITKESDQTTEINTDTSAMIRQMALAGRTSSSNTNTDNTYGFNPSHNPNSGDMIFREQMMTTYVTNGGTLPNTNESCKTVEEAMKKAVHFYSMLQTEDGHWAGDYGGPHFLMPGMIITWYVMGKPSLMLNDGQCALMAHYLKVHQQSDGGWGTHIESPSTMFGTTLSYVALRLLGVDPNDKDMLRGKAFIRNQGGVTMTSSWAKFWLCILGCMEWEGHDSVPPEMWLLPNWFPFHPGRLWCHCRMVYLPMGYLYGSRFVYEKAETDDIILSLRKELYCDDYASIPWRKTRHFIAPMDNYSPIPFVMEFAQNAMARYESWAIFQPFKNFVRRLGLAFSAEYMAAEDLQTNFIDIGPVNKVMNMLSAYHVANGDLKHPTVVNHMLRTADYLWLAEDGMKMQGYNGSQCWDTSFAIQAISECGLLDEFPNVSKKVWSYFERTQILSTEVSQASPAYNYESFQNRNKYYRHVSKGGWPFSTSAHGWPISDCTGEGLKGVIVLLKSKSVQDAIQSGSLRDISESRLQDAVNVILTLQNEDGGWATYENNRGFGWYEQLNPSEVFGDIMIDYSYAECSMASLTALVDFHKLYPDHRTKEVLHSIEEGRRFFESIQRDDGSWYGSWACCFCYGCWFGIEGLRKAGEKPSSPAILKCCKFLLSKQRENGGWGEDFTSCYDKDYAENGMDSYGDDGSGVVNTAWSLLALSEAKCDDIEAVKRGVQYLMKRQLPSGDWPQEGISGVFNRACGITYTAYRNVFPIWALGRCRETYGADLEM